MVEGYDYEPGTPYLDNTTGHTIRIFCTSYYDNFSRTYQYTVKRWVTYESKDGNLYSCSTDEFETTWNELETDKEGNLTPLRKQRFSQLTEEEFISLWEK